MDHIKKLVYTIVGCLTIVSLTFTICTKVGHCASNESDFITCDSYPLPFNSSYVGYSLFEISDTFKSNMISAYTPTNDYPIALFTVYQQNNVILYHVWQYQSLDRLVCNAGTFGEAFANLDFNNVGTFYRYSIDSDGVVDYVGSYYQGNGLLRTNPFYYLFVSPDHIMLSTFAEHYPLFAYNYSTNSFIDTIPDSNGNIIFQKYANSNNLGHTKGGVLGNYIDSHDLIENSSDIPHVDVTSPSDSSSIPGWLQKILNGLGVINGSIQSGVLTIGDYIGQFKESVDNAISWITETPDIDEILDNVVPYLAENDLISGFLSSKTAIQGVYSSIGNVTAKTRSQMVWDIPFNLPSMSQTFHARIDFGWYENIRSTFEPFLNMFLCVTFLFSFLRSIPGIIHGNSGEGDT